MPKNPRMLSIDRLRELIAEGSIDTVVLAFTDMQGRLQGKYIHGEFFVQDVLSHGAEGCNYLLAVDTEMNTVDGYAMTSWESGYGDMVFDLDLETIRRLPHVPGTAMIQCDLKLVDGSPLQVSPRTILKQQADRAARLGWQALSGTELEFVVYNNSYEEAWTARYLDLVPANQYNVDYSILGSARVEPLLREIRNATYAAGLTPESAEGNATWGNTRSRSSTTTCSAPRTTIRSTRP